MMKYSTMTFVFFFMTSPDQARSRRLITDWQRESYQCHYPKCGRVSSNFNCQCENPGWKESYPECIPSSWLCDGRQDCSNNADEMECKCPPGQFQCGSGRGGEAEHYTDQYNCIPIALVDDGNYDCFNWKDEPSSLCSYIPSIRCNGWIHCSHAGDEKNCSDCPSRRPNRCDCNKLGDEFSCTGFGHICYPDHYRCDGRVHCVDASDEDECACKDDQFTCQCYRNHPKSCSLRKRGCIPKGQYRNENEDCEDGSDEREYVTRTKCGGCDVTVRRLDSIKQCDKLLDCDNSSCVTVPALNCTDFVNCSETEVICTSHCNTSNAAKSCNTIFQCANGYLEVAHNFCDGKVDCPDGSDEITNQPGFKCSTSFGRCVLPQRNIHDDVAKCIDTTSNYLFPEHSLFACLDGKLKILQTQLCDGVNDCFDLSDECLCQIYLNKIICQKMFVENDPSKVECMKEYWQIDHVEATLRKKTQRDNRTSFNRRINATYRSHKPLHVPCTSKFGEITAVMCDGRPECKNFVDECSCDDPPGFCNSSCHTYYPLGDRYCDGIIDEAWKYINDSSCPEGFDEVSCPQRFACKAGNLVSIDLVEFCDGNADCDDESDESSCMRDSLFSSDSEMIENVPLRRAFWAMAMLVIVCNCSVLFSTTRILCKQKMNESQRFNHVLVFNLSLSDFLMGFYLFAISVKSVQYSGLYGKVDYQWRTSLECSIIGSLAVLSSEASCFIVTIITAFRLYNICNPFTSQTASTLKWKLGIAVAWSVSLVLSLLPLFKQTSNYFVHEIWFSNEFTTSEVWNKTDVMAFACRLAYLSNQSIEVKGNSWLSTMSFLTKYFPQYSPKGEFGYYSETSVCMPRIYVNHGEHPWMYSFGIISFNFIAFLFVVSGYAIIYFQTTHSSSKHNSSDKETARMQKRMARLIATDFACWIPICIMVYLKTGGVEISNVIYTVTAVVLLPINSALNPLLYSSFIEGLFEKNFFRKYSQLRQEFQLYNLNYF